MTKFSDQVMVSWPTGDSNRVEELQTAQIAALQVQVSRLDNISKNSVFVDPVRSTQEQLYAHLIAIREGMHKSLVEAIDTASSVTGSAAAGTEKSAIDSEAESLRAENKKLQYRVTHLLRTIDELESAKTK